MPIQTQHTVGLHTKKFRQLLPEGTTGDQGRQNILAVKAPNPGARLLRADSAAWF